MPGKRSPVLPSDDALGGGMLTFARLRPLDRDVDCRRRIAYEIQGGANDETEETLRLRIPEKHRNALSGNKQVASYKFSGVLGEDATQQDVYEAVAFDVVSACLRGYSGAIFAYGQTNSGKTWTVTGGEGFDDRGFAPRAIGHLFRGIRKAESRGPAVRYKVHASYLEIYEGRVHDLLDVSSRGKPEEDRAVVSLQSDGDGNQVLKGLVSFKVTNEEDTLNLFFMGNSHRVMSEASRNRFSSRCHAVFTLAIVLEREEGTALGDEGGGNYNTSRTGTNTIVSRGELNLVDLAGCERMYENDRHGHTAGLKDDNAPQPLAGATVSLNKLERVILALKKPESFVPYHESTLTSVLRRSLGIMCRTVFVISLSVDVEDLQETIASCRFAQSCRKVVCRPVADERLDPGQELSLLRREANHLRASLRAKDALLRVLTEEVRDKQVELEASTRQREAVEAAQAFHTNRPLTEEDKEACAVLVEALVGGSEEASEALEDLDRVSVLQCCRELQEMFIVSSPPPLPPLPTKDFVDASVSQRPPGRNKGKSEETQRRLTVARSENTQLMAIGHPSDTNPATPVVAAEDEGLGKSRRNDDRDYSIIKLDIGGAQRDDKQEEVEGQNLSELEAKQCEEVVVVAEGQGDSDGAKNVGGTRSALELRPSKGDRSGRRPPAPAIDFQSMTRMVCCRRTAILQASDKFTQSNSSSTLCGSPSVHSSAKQFPRDGAHCRSPLRLNGSASPPPETRGVAGERQARSHTHRAHPCNSGFDRASGSETCGCSIETERGKDFDVDDLKVGGAGTEPGATPPVRTAGAQKPRPNLKHSTGTRQIVGLIHRVRSPTLSVLGRENDTAKGDWNGKHELRHGGGGNSFDPLNDQEMPRLDLLDKGTEKNFLQDHGENVALLTRGGFFVMHRRFGFSRVRFVWMSKDLETILWRCGGNNKVLGSKHTALFDSVHLTFNTKNNRHASALTATTETGNLADAKNRIALVGSRGRHRLLLEVDAGELDTDARKSELEKWFEAFKYAIRFANAGAVDQKMLRSERKPRPAVWAAELQPFDGSGRHRLGGTAPSISLRATTLATANFTTSGDTNGRRAIARKPTAPAVLAGADSSLSGSPRFHAGDDPSLPPSTTSRGRNTSIIGSSSSGGGVMRNPESSSKDNAPGGDLRTGRVYGFFHPPSIYTTCNLKGFMGPSSPSARGRSGAPSPRVIMVDDGVEGHHDRDADETKSVGKRIPNNAPAVSGAVEATSLPPIDTLTSPPPSGATATTSPRFTTTGDGRGGTGSKRRCMLPIRQLKATPALPVDLRLSSPRASDGRAGRQRCTSGNDVRFDIGV